MPRTRLLLATAALPVALASPAHAIEVVASIKPVHSLVAGVMEGVGEPSLLVEGAGSPHTYSLRPSQAGELEDAGVVFWIGDGMETFLAGPLESLAGDARTVALEEAAGLTLLEYREGGAFEAHDHGDHSHGGHDHREESHEHGEEGHHHDHGGDHAGHDHSGYDMHLWLDPDNAAAMIDVITSTLSAEDPENASAYADNAAAMKERLEELEAGITAELEAVADRPFIVFHDAYQYFENHFGLEAAGAITVSGGIDPGAARIAEMQKKVRDLGATCIFSEPQFESRIVEVVAEGSDAKSGVLDPLGAEIEDGPELYFTLMQEMADAFASCLSAE